MASKLNLKPLCGADIPVNKKKSGHNGDLTGLQNYFPTVFRCDSQLRVLENKKFLKEIIVFPIFDIFFFLTSIRTQQRMKRGLLRHKQI